jgi:Flp pilus assembly protein TadD
MPSTKRAIYLALALLAAILVAYSYTWHCDFIDYDDNNHVYENERVRAGLSVANVVWAFTHFHASQWIPLTWVSFMADISLFGLDPGPLHLVNVALHYVNTLLLFGILWKMTGAFWRSACVAALFALHPINVETVAWITERKSLLNTLFWFLAIACHLKYASTGNRRWVLLTAGCMALGVMTKAMIVTLPFTLLLLDAWPLRRFPNVAWHRLLLEKTPLFMLSVVACIVQIRAGMASKLLWTTEMAPIPFRIFTAAENALHYVGTLIFPARLAIQYPVSYQTPYVEGTISVAVFGLFMALGWKLRKRAPYLLVGGLWFLGTMVPVSGIVRAGDAVFADRYTYVPQIGFFVVAVWSLAALLHGRARTVAVPLAGASLAIFTFMTANYVTKWTDTITLFTHATKVHPTCRRAHEVVANTHSGMKNWQAAAHHYGVAVALAPGGAANRNSYGVHLSKIGEFDAAIVQFRRAAQDDPRLLAARFNLGTHLVVQKGGAAEAIDLLTEVLKEDPSLTIAHFWIGKALEAEGRREEARKAYQKRLAAMPADHSASDAIARLDSAS